MSKTHLVLPDQHAHPDYTNERADWLGRFIKEVKPDVVINIGDAADMPSLSSYDRGKRSFYGRSYRKDIDSHLEFQDRLWGPMKRSKKKMPLRIIHEGNHEERIERALDLSPELSGTISFADLDFDNYYDIVIRYDGLNPGINTLDGISYAHYFVSGVKGLAVSGEHPGYSLITKEFVSCTQGHTHTLDFATRVSATGNRLCGLVCGVYQDYRSSWAGQANDLWWSGVILKKNVSAGSYDPQFISLDALRKEYG